MQEQQRYRKKEFGSLRVLAVRERLRFLRLRAGLYKKSEKGEVVCAENFDVAPVKIAACHCFSKHVENRDGDRFRVDQNDYGRVARAPRRVSVVDYRIDSFDVHYVALSRRLQAKKCCGESRISSLVTAYFAAFSDAATGINTTRLLTMAESNEQ